MTSRSYGPSAVERAGELWLAEGGLVSLRKLYYVASLGAIVVGYYLYWIVWQIRWFYIGIAVASLLSLAFVIMADRDSKGLFRSMVPLMVWELYLCVSTYWSPDVAVSQYYLIPLGFFVLTFVVGYVWLRNVGMWELSSFLPIMALTQLPIIIYTLITIGQLYDQNLGAVRTGLAAFMLFSVPFFAWRARKRPTVLRIALVGLAMLILAGSGSRTGPVLGAIALLGTLTFAEPPKGRKWRAFVRGVAGLFVVGLMALAVPQVRQGATDAGDKFATQTAFSWADWTDESRFSMAEGDRPADFDRRLQVLVILQSFREHPWRGNGYFSTYTITNNMLGYPISAHGLISLLLGETGIIGASIFITMIVIWFRRVNRAIRLAVTNEQRGWWVTCKWTMIAMITIGIFHQIDQTPSFYIVLAWGFAAQYRTTNAFPDSPLRA